MCPHARSSDDKYRDEDEDDVIERNDRVPATSSAVRDQSTKERLRQFMTQRHGNSANPLLGNNSSTHTMLASYVTPSERDLTGADTTDSRVVRETERRFLNDTPAVAPYRYNTHVWSVQNNVHSEQSRQVFPTSASEQLLA